MAENYYYSSLSGDEIEQTLLGAVRFNTDQSLTTSQKAAARANIGAGESNSTFKILGYFDTLEDLQEWLQVLPQSGDAYGIGTASPYDVYVYDGIHNTWVNNGPIAYSDALIDDNDISLERTWSSTKISDQISGKQAKVNVSGILKGSGGGNVSAATLGPDYTAVDDSLDSSTTKTYSIDKIKSLEPTGLVSYAEAQTLTDAQKQQARVNIGAERIWTTLWSNASPASAFQAQTVQLDLTGFSFVAIRFRMNTSAETIYPLQFYKIGDISFCRQLLNSGSNLMSRTRPVEITSTAVAFGDCQDITQGSSGQVNNNGNVPVEIVAF